MAAVRRDITTNATDANRFVQAVQALKAESAGHQHHRRRHRRRTARRRPAAVDVGPVRDLARVGHAAALGSDGRRNAAHMGPVFLPWHRWYLLVLEANMQRVLGVSRDDFGLPYWDWSADGTNLTPAQQRTDAAVWRIVGGNGRPTDRQVVDGPFVQPSFDIRVEQGPSGALRATNRGLRRNFGVDANRLPRQGRRRRRRWPTASTTSPAGTPAPRRSATSSRAGSPAARRCTTGSTCGSAATWPPARRRTTPCSSSTTASSTGCGRVWQAADPAHGYQPTGRQPRPTRSTGTALQDPIYSILTRNQPSVESMLRVDTFYTYA